jgi:hypothetical protein
MILLQPGVAAKSVFRRTPTVQELALQELPASGTGVFVTPMNDRFAFQRSAGSIFGLFPGGFGGRPYLFDAGEEQIAAMLLVERDWILVAQPSGLDLRPDQDSAIEAVAGEPHDHHTEQGQTCRS